MGTKRKDTYLGRAIYREEYHDGRYGAPGMKREKKKKATPEQIAKVNAWNKTKRVWQRLLMYFTENDWLVTLTYKKEERPPDAKTAKKDFATFRRKIAKVYEKKGVELRWIKNLENTSRGNWHVHLVIKDIEDIARILNDCWPYGRVDLKPMYKRGEFKDLATYISKDERSTREEIGDCLDHKVTEAYYSTSKNMPLPEPKVKVLKRWQKEPKAKGGYYIDWDSYYEGINPVTGYKFRRYLMIRLGGGD